MTRVALYVRVSTEDQKIYGLSIEDQVEKLTKWAEKQNAVVVGFYNDAGISARKPASKRPELQRLLLDVKAGKIDLIVFTRLDRWFRNISEYYKVQDVLEANNVGWKTIYEDYDTTTASGRLKINIMLSVAQDEADRTAERIKSINNSKIERKETIGGKAPFGYKIENKHFVVDEEKAKIVADIFNRYIAGRSIRMLRKYIMDTYSMTYSHNGLVTILKNERYIGRAHDDDNFLPAIIPKEIFEKVQDILAVRAQRYTYPKSNYVYIFSGIVFCAECGIRLSSHNIRGKYIYYYCKKHKQEHLCPHNKSVNQSMLEKWLLLNLPSKLMEYNLNIIEQAKSAPPKIDIAKIQRKIEKLKDLYLNDLIDRDIYEKDYKNLKEELAKASIVQEKLKKPINIDTILESLSIYPKLSEDGKKEFWSRILKKIVISNDDFFIEPCLPY